MPPRRRKGRTTATLTATTTTTTRNDSNKDPPTKDDTCLHCHKVSDSIQVRCDECCAYICNDCHWCHEYQANHEVRVCDTCDAFYCKQCDEMDQCDDCGHVSCGNCCTLLSCKFCGGGLCDDCAISCGRCGIVLCRRDAKFAVDCDTCRLSYCLVCLASTAGTKKEPCVRCGQYASKRMEQLVHLRLKSIYKAFKQSSSSVAKEMHKDDHVDDDEDNDGILDKDPQSLFQAAASAAKSSAAAASAAKKHSAATTTKEHYMAEKKKADAAAAALLAELDEEEEALKSKKSKKKRKKERKAKKEDTVKVEPRESGIDETATDSDNDSDDDDDDDESDAKPKAKDTSKDDTSTTEPEKVAEQQVTEEEPSLDPLEQQLVELVEDGDKEGLEELLASIKGVPGRAVLRKNAKKALKRLKLEEEQQQEQAEQEEEPPFSNTAREARSDSATPTPELNGHGDLLKLISMTHNKAATVPAGSTMTTTRQRSTSTTNRSECVMHMAPHIVGWVIGKGGQRIRDIMEESGARVWIDQDNMGPNDPRIVYVSGNRKNVDTAVYFIEDLISKAPTGTPHSRQTTPVVADTNAAASKHAPGKPPMIPDDAGDDTAAGKNLKPRGHYDNNKTKHTMTCDPRFVPLLIGRRGWTIKHIQDSCGVRVDIDQTVTPRKITISGSEDNVKQAIGMVRDVLSYPHAQLHGAPEDEPGANNNGDDKQPAKADSAKKISSPPVPQASPLNDDKPQPQSSPPSSLVMTGDAQTTISASSSLSSTPEPSLKKVPYSQLAAAPLLPPAYGSSDAAVKAANTSLNEMPLSGPVAATSVFSSGGIGGVPQDTGFGSPLQQSSRLIPPQQQQQQAQLGPIGGSSMLHEPSQMMPGGDQIRPSPPTQQQQQQQQPPYMSTQNPFPPAQSGAFGSVPNVHQQKPIPVHKPSAFHPSQPGFNAPLPSNEIGNQDARARAAPGDLWNLPPRGASLDASVPVPSPGGFRLDAAVDFLEHSKQHRSDSLPLPGGVNELMGLPNQSVAREAAPIGFNRRDSAPSTMSPGRESLIVDSLFAGSDASATNLLSGVQGLAISNKEVGGGGLWGAADTNSSDEVKGLSLGIGLEGASSDQAPPSLFGAAQPTMAPNDPQHHPSRSRFGWGAAPEGQT